LLLVDSGNFTDNPTPEGEVRTRALVEAMSRLGYAACNVADRELALGYDAFVERTQGASFPFLSANIVRQDTQQPVFKPYVTVTATSPNGAVSHNVGLIGATRFNPLFLKAGPEGSSLVIAKPEDVLARYVEAVRKEADLVVLLAALHKEEAKRIVSKVPGIDFVVGAYGGMVTLEDEKAGPSTWIGYAGNQGKRVGETRLYLNAERQVASVNTTMHLLSAVYPSDPAMLGFVNQVLADLANRKSEPGVPASGSEASR
jgi:2',3'-cyclic-nucleotide 2'-phosphodiesterase (5'-nucleotidase family)